ncbi:hypothetical protein [Rhodococcus sp. T7]|uniref:hypothetical protein n=1 Tax=Rhodococcus sp. T7 TaxID=627444 RepID=UPI001359F1AC|nr:hypothetical protein [Rhodococcus sp. T7]KAF0957183.1 hypothetical protein MLGJGCBP_09013 [Rhodococcus sp. T7]KAF0959021.1 hypothetical protein MLGJGCBP_07898 [Rhodococcus sp. T7]
MRPTIDEQLNGAARLLRLAEGDPETSPGVAELARNARRLIERVEASWARALPFLQTDNRRLAELLGIAEPDPHDSNDVAAAAASNEALRAHLTSRIHELPAGPEREAIGAYLRARLVVDPT